MASRPGRIDDAEVTLIRRLIFAPAGDGPAKVSAAEAEMLFRLKDATLGKDNSPEWKKLFVQGVANHLMAHRAMCRLRPPKSSGSRRLPVASLRPRLSRLGSEVASPHEFHDAVFGEDQDEAIDEVQCRCRGDAEVTAGEGDWLKRLYDRMAARRV